MLTCLDILLRANKIKISCPSYARHHVYGIPNSESVLLLKISFLQIYPTIKMLYLLWLFVDIEILKNLHTLTGASGAYKEKKVMIHLSRKVNENSSKSSKIM